MLGVGGGTWIDLDLGDEGKKGKGLAGRCVKGAERRCVAVGDSVWRDCGMEILVSVVDRLFYVGCGLHICRCWAWSSHRI